MLRARSALLCITTELVERGSRLGMGWRWTRYRMWRTYWRESQGRNHGRGCRLFGKGGIVGNDKRLRFNVVELISRQL